MYKHVSHELKGPFKAHWICGPVGYLDIVQRPGFHDLNANTLAGAEDPASVCHLASAPRLQKCRTVKIVYSGPSIAWPSTAVNESQSPQLSHELGRPQSRSQSLGTTMVIQLVVHLG